MLTLLVYFVVVLIVLSLLMWLVDYIPVQAPFNRWAKIAIVVVGVLIIIGLLLNAAGIDTGLRTGPPVVR